MAPALVRVLGSESQSRKEKAGLQGERPTKSKPAQTAYRPRHCPSTANVDSSAQVHSEEPTLRQMAAIRLSELYRLSLYCRRHRLSSANPSDWLYVLASTLACGERCVRSDDARRASVVWEGLDFLTLKEAIRRADLGHFDDSEVERAMAAAEAWKAKNGTHLMPRGWLGQKLQLTAAVREELNIRTIDACDESREERQERVKERRRARDREAKRATREAKRQAECLSKFGPVANSGAGRRMGRTDPSFTLC
jgi:hypothetical protein